MKFIAYFRRAVRRNLDVLTQREAVRRKLGSDAMLEFTEVEIGRRGERPELIRALDACREHKASLLVATMDGLSRDRLFLRALADAGVMVAFCDFPVPDGAGGRFTLQMMAQVAELESGIASRRTKAALRARVENGGQWDRNARHHLVPGAGQAAAVRAIRERADAHAAQVIGIIRPLADQGLTLAAIADTLNARGVPTARRGRWTPTSVKRVLDRIGK
ncbi:recombinase family protein [Emcibacter sp. SYSU 3D8]|uniref:recombinase family protein n=1 Tax=Emcibacter sp. SYSU 3D8 TaxID=3133969 RepID=UPI0031FEDF9B